MTAEVLVVILVLSHISAFFIGANYGKQRTARLIKDTITTHNDGSITAEY